MEVNIGEIIVEEELEIGGLELDVLKVGGGISGAKEVHIGTDEPTGDEVIWIDPSEEADKIPTKTSELENDSKFVNEEFVTNKIAEAELSGGDVDLSDYAKKTDIPDVSGFITEIPSEYVTETELDKKGYLTEHQDLREYAKKTDIPSVDEFVTEEYVNTAIQNVLEVVENGTY